MKSFLISLATISLMMMVYNGNALALSSDRDQPAQIEADETEIDFKTGTRILTSNVLVIQGTLRLKADKLVADYNKKGELIKAIADGSLARFKQRPDNQPDDVEGWGKKITIDYPTNTLTLIGNAALKQGGSTARGNTIVYNMATDKLKIMGGSSFDSSGKGGKAAPQRKIKDPFADDIPVATKTTKTHSAKSSKWSTADSNNTADTSPSPEPEAEQAIAEPVKSGRSRLILQPRKKTDNTDK